jgi:hypothetical protein
MKAIAYWHGPERVRKYAQAFANGCPIPCRVEHVSKCGPHDADVVWLYGLGEALPVFERHKKSLRLVGDKGYFAGCGTEKHLRVSVNAQQPDKHLQLRRHNPDRFLALGINVEPVSKRGEHILLCGMGPKQCKIQGLQYGEWEQRTMDRLKAITDRKIIVCEKPKNPPIPNVPRSEYPSTADAIRDAWAVVCLTGNIGVDSILHGVPVIAEAGPGSVYYKATLADIETIQPISAEQRLSALSDIAYWQWKREELVSGEFWRHLAKEGLV